MRRFIGWTLLAVLATSAPRASGSEPPREISMAVVSPPNLDCVEADTLRQDVRERVGSVTFSDALSARRVEVRLVARAERVSASIRVTDDRGRVLGERTLPAEEGGCDELERSLVLVISTLIGIQEEEPRPAEDGVEQERARERLERPDEPARRGPSLEPPPDVVKPAPPRETPAEPFHLGLSALGGVHSGLLPGITPLASVRLLARRDWFGLRAGITGAPVAVRDLGGGAEATFRAVLGDVDLCGVTSGGAVGDFDFCAGGRAGVLHAETEGLYQNATTNRPVAQFTMRTSLQVPLSKGQALLFELGGALPILPQTYVFVEAGGQEKAIHTLELGAFAEIGGVLWFGS